MELSIIGANMSWTVLTYYMTEEPFFVDFGYLSHLPYVSIGHNACCKKISNIFSWDFEGWPEYSKPIITRWNHLYDMKRNFCRFVSDMSDTSRK